MVITHYLMRKFTMIIVLGVLAAFASSSFAVEKTDESPAKFIADWAATFNKNDPKLLSDFYDRSEDIEVIISAGIRHKGFKAVDKFYIDDHKAVRFYDSAVTNISSRILGETALVTFEHQLKFQIHEDGSHWQVHVRTTSVLHRMDGEWKIVLEHSSPIRGTERVTRIQE